MLAAARLGDRASFDCIIAHYDPRLRILAGQMMRDLSDADDALQEAYIKAYRALPRFRGDSALSSWLYRITYRCCLDQLRRRAVPTDSLEVLCETESADDVDPASLVASRDALRSALAMLTPIQRAVLFLIHCEDMSYGDAARVLDVPPGTVGSRVASARAALKNVLLAAGIQGGTR
jgi:RNA polymerase sigma-70 factor (ECF subfamily)